MELQPDATSTEDWLKARKALLDKEKAYTRLGDEIAAERRKLPWRRVEKDYTFETSAGKRTLGDLFGARSQLIVYHFMFAPDWDVGCKSCSFWADHFAATLPHLAARNVALVAVSRAPLAKLKAFAERMGWTHEWVSSAQSDFNFDFGVSFAEQGDAGEATYNYAPKKMPGEELPGISVFIKDDSGAIFNTYSCYARGLDTVNATYRLLDLTPRGRDEGGLPYSMSWVRLKDEYGR